MQINSLKRVHPNKTSHQVGRGGTRGKTSGKGTKGQNARAGRKKHPEIRDVIKRLPKLRGRGKNSNLSIQRKMAVVNLGALNAFKAGEVVTPKTLLEKGLVRKLDNTLPKVKILGDGEFTQKLNFQSCIVSVSARKKIEALGGSIE
jgi:large subunit ribosomal protein L15